MKKTMLAAAVAASVTLSASAQQRNVAVTIYNDNLAVINDSRVMNIPKGVSEVRLTDVAQTIDPTSVRISFEGVPLEQNYQYDLVSAEKILQKYIDKQISLIGKNNELLEGKLLSASGGIVLQKNDGGLQIVNNMQDYRINVAALPEGLITRPTLVWKLDAKKAGEQPVKVSYHAGGMSWAAEYVVNLSDDEKTLDMTAWVNIENNSGTRYENANLKLIAGEVNRVRPQQPWMMAKGSARTVAAEVQDFAFVEKEFFEYHLYDLQRPATLENNEQKQLALFEANKVNVEKRFVYQNAEVSTKLEFINSTNNNMGKPMPKGKVRVHKSDGNSLQFIGEDMVEHTPRDEKILLTLGKAFDVVGSEKPISQRQITNTVWEEEIEITLKNRKSTGNVTIEVPRYIGPNTEIISSSMPFTKDRADQILFKVPVKANEEVKLVYKYRINN